LVVVMKFDLLRRQQLAAATAAADAAFQAKIRAMTDAEIEALLDNPTGRKLKLMTDEELEKLAGY
jgi:hypothetical protein